jgi:hypothetical protein
MNSVASSVIVLRGGGTIVRVAEADVARVEVEQPLVGDGDAVGVAADVVEHLSRAGERPFRVDDPLGLARGVEMIGEAPGIGERLEGAGEPELASVECRLHGGQAEATEEPRQHADRQKEARAAGDPAAPIGRQATTGDDAMEMGMVDQRLPPGVEDGEEADLGAQMLRVGGNRAQGLGGRPEEDPVDHRLILHGDLGDRLGHGEDDVEILGVDRSDFRR